MTIVSILLDLANILFFFANIPQFWRTLKSRKYPERLKGISFFTFLGNFIAGTIFITVGLLLGAWFMVSLNLINIIFFGLQMYWKRKYK